ncbi:unnamed protein product [Rotaria magnacalcarata]|uniref:Uncharacterized protein n=2 Tax=Rotaria magnacalcarata TaxID=392030 RepID=A0A814VVV0_9BILA|nr:unnamed protein product [Rotaria magnacalcarata]CAF4108487.1 unnamed protein product [Rotaria magnacalcarata]CAF4120571.1 unnamed protein product [Rotaria magnacalcarata]
MGNKKNVKRCSQQFSVKKLARQRQLPAKLSSSVTSKIDARAAITTASSIRQSLPSKEKIEKNKKINDVPNQTRSDVNVPMDGYTIIQNQILHSLMRQTKCQSCGNVWNGAMTTKKREGEVFHVMCGYRGSYTNRAMESFNKSRLHTEAKQFSRQEKAASARITSSNNDKKDDSLVDSVADTDDGYHDTFYSTDGTSQTDHLSCDDDVRTSTDDHSTSSDEQSDSEDYAYYNPDGSCGSWWILIKGIELHNRLTGVYGNLLEATQGGKGGFSGF